MPPLIVFALGVMGAAVVVRWCVKEVHRVNTELDEMRAKATVEPTRSRRLAETEARSEDRRIPAGVEFRHSGASRSEEPGIHIHDS